MAKIPKAILMVQGGPQNGKTVNLPDGTTLIGRDESNDVVVDETEVSRRHAGIRTNPDGYWIEDLGSKNGTFVNRTLIEGEGQRLSDRDLIELGGTGTAVHLVFRELGATANGGDFQTSTAVGRLGFFIPQPFLTSTRVPITGGSAD